MSKKSGGSGISLNKISFYLILVAAILYLLGIIFAAVGGALAGVVAYLQAVATAMMIVVVAILAWRYVRSKPAIWLVLYFVLLLILIAGIVVPMIL